MLLSSVTTMPPSPTEIDFLGWKLRQATLPCDPTGLPLYKDPIAQAASSSSVMPAGSAARSRSMSAARPTWCTASTAFVFFVTRFATSAGSMFQVPSSISANTGVAPACITEFGVAMNVYDGQITSSPGPMPLAMSDRCSDVVHDVVATACAAPMYDATRDSNSETLGPCTTHPVLRTSATACASASPKSGLVKGIMNWQLRARGATRRPGRAGLPRGRRRHGNRALSPRRPRTRDASAQDSPCGPAHTADAAE